MQRILVIAIGLALLGGTSWWVQTQSSATNSIALNLLGETWYSIRLAGQHVGFMYNLANQDLDGRWHFRTITQFRLEEGAPNTIDKHLIFAAHSPYELERAIYRNRQGVRGALSTSMTQVARSHAPPAAYQATLVRDGRMTNTDLDWAFSLEDFVSFETWLQESQPQADAQSMTKSPDFERLRIVQRGYRVVARNQDGYLVSTSAPLQATITQLDHRYRPIKLTMAGVFDVTATDRANAVALHSLPRKTSYLIPIDERIEDHMNVASLTLRLSNPPPGLSSRLKLKAGTTTASDADIKRYLGEELRFPITDPQIQTLVQRLQSQQRGSPVLASLVSAAHQQLEYVEDGPAGTVLKALARGTGECTDFADLLTTLARAAGYPARTVYGLAYRDGSRPAFMMHAWNEIKLETDEPWIAVDPTWNQIRTDATHIPLSEAQAAAMVLAASTEPIEFKLEAVTYF